MSRELLKSWSRSRQKQTNAGEGGYMRPKNVSCGCGCGGRFYCLLLLWLCYLVGALSVPYTEHTLGGPVDRSSFPPVGFTLLSPLESPELC